MSSRLSSLTTPSPAHEHNDMRELELEAGETLPVERSGQYRPPAAPNLNA